MPTIRSLPDAREAASTDDDTILEALRRAGIDIVHACGGKARCTTCRVRVLTGLEACTPRTDAERTLADRLGLEDEVRLACQTRAGADISVRRLVLDPEDSELTKQFTQRTTPASMGKEASVAVLFVDVEGFTHLSEVLPAYDVVHVLHRWFHQATAAIEAHGGRVDNYMGDGCLAVFPGTEAEASRAAVRAGLGLLAAAARTATWLRAAYDRDFGVRIGVHGGSVIVGSPTPWHRERDTVIGDVVNIASRIEAKNKDLGTRFLVSDAVFRHLEPEVKVGRRAEVEIRNRSGVHTVYEILGPLPDLGPKHDAEAAPPPIS